MRKDLIEIIYQDEDILVVNKPPSMSVTNDRSGEEELLPLLMKQLKIADVGKLLLIHRLDKETSGVLLLAKNTPSQREMSDYFSNAVVKKTYLTLVRGAAIAKEGIIDSPIGNDRTNPRLMRIDQSTRGKNAVTLWRRLADFGGIALLMVQPVTGRTHQIRIHLPAAGMPLAVDKLYGSGEGLMLSCFKSDYRLRKNAVEKPLIDRLTLHAYQLEIPEQPPPRPSRFVAKLDKRFSATIKMLTKYNPRGLEAFENADTLKTIFATGYLD